MSYYWTSNLDYLWNCLCHGHRTNHYSVDRSPSHELAVCPRAIETSLETHWKPDLYLELLSWSVAVPHCNVPNFWRQLKRVSRMQFSDSDSGASLLDFGEVHRSGSDSRRRIGEFRWKPGQRFCFLVCSVRWPIAACFESNLLFANSWTWIYWLASVFFEVCPDCPCCSKNCR